MLKQKNAITVSQGPAKIVENEKIENQFSNKKMLHLKINSVFLFRQKIFPEIS